MSFEDQLDRFIFGCLVWLALFVAAAMFFLAWTLRETDTSLIECEPGANAEYECWPRR